MYAYMTALRVHQEQYDLMGHEPPVYKSEDFEYITHKQGQPVYNHKVPVVMYDEAKRA